VVIEFDDIELKHPDARGGNVYFYNGQPFSPAPQSLLALRNNKKIINKESLSLYNYI